MPRDKWEKTWPMEANAVGQTLVFHRCQFLVCHESIIIIRLFFLFFTLRSVECNYLLCKFVGYT